MGQTEARKLYVSTRVMSHGCVQENIHRNFGMPQPNGYRKALRFMRHADHFGFPILTFVDTPGAYAGKAAEEQGQASLSHPPLRWSASKYCR